MAYYREPVYQPVPASGEPVRAAFVWDCLFGFDPDSTLEERLLAGEFQSLVPLAKRTAIAHRGFRNRAALHLLLSRGVRQFIDLGAGVLPRKGKPHSSLLTRDRSVRLVYVDSDPQIADLIARDVAGLPTVTALHADLRQPDTIVGNEAVRALIDFSKPVAVLATNALQHVSDAEDPAGVLAAYRNALAPRSALVLSHPVSDHLDPAIAERIADIYRRNGHPYVFRRTEQITGWFNGFDLVPVGLRHDRAAVPVATWGTRDEPAPDRAPGTPLFAGGVGLLSESDG